MLEPRDGYTEGYHDGRRDERNEIIRDLAFQQHQPGIANTPVSGSPDFLAKWQEDQKNQAKPKSSQGRELAKGLLIGTVVVVILVFCLYQGVKHGFGPSSPF